MKLLKIGAAQSTSRGPHGDHHAASSAELADKLRKFVEVAKSYGHPVAVDLEVLERLAHHPAQFNPYGVVAHEAAPRAPQDTLPGIKDTGETGELRFERRGRCPVHELGTVGTSSGECTCGRQVIKD